MRTVIGLVAPAFVFCLASRLAVADDGIGDFAEHFWCPQKGVIFPPPPPWDDACPDAWKWEDQLYIPVFIHPQLNLHMVHSDGITTWNRLELEHEVKLILERLNDQSGANVPPLVFVAFEDEWLGEIPEWDAPGTTKRSITLRPNLSGDCRQYQQGCQDHDTGARIFFGSSQQCPNLHWDHFVIGGGVNINRFKTFGGTLMHELMHGMGFAHFDECNDETPFGGCQSPAGFTCGNMDPSGVSSSQIQLLFDDVDALRTYYGDAKGPLDYQLRRESLDAADWTTLTTSMPFTAHFFGAASSNPAVSGPFMPLVTTDEELSPHQYLFLPGFDLFTSCGGVPDTPQFGQVGTASGFAGTILSFFMSGQLPFDTRMFPYYANHACTGSPPSVDVTTSSGALFETNRSGHTGAVDNRFGQLIHVWRTVENNIALALTETNGLQQIAVPRVLTDQTASYTPSVACGDSSILFNCILVWASQPTVPTGFDAHYHLLRYQQFRIVDVGNGEFDFDLSQSVFETGWVQYGPPSVVYKGPPGGADAFVVAWKVPGSCYFTATKGPGVSDEPDRDSVVSHCSDIPCGDIPTLPDCIRVGPPAIGADGLPISGIVEAWAVGNDMFSSL